MPFDIRVQPHAIGGHVIYRVTFGFTGAGKGWAETHACLNAADNPLLLAPTMEDIASKRAQMLGREFAIVAIRISRYATDAGVRSRGVKLVKKTFRHSTQTASAGAEPAEVALLVRGSAEPSILNPQFNTNQNTTFLGAPLDVSVDDGGQVFEGKGGLGAAFGAWRTAMLTATMGWLADETILNVGILGIAQNANGTVTYTFPPTVLASLTLGAKYKARVRSVNQGRSPLNIEQIVRVDSPVTLVTERVIGIPTPQTLGSIRLYRIVKPFVDYGDLQLADRVGKHQRGRPYGSSPGRLRDRVLG